MNTETTFSKLHELTSNSQTKISIYPIIKPHVCCNTHFLSTLLRKIELLLQRGVQTKSPEFSHNENWKELTNPNTKRIRT